MRCKNLNTFKNTFFKMLLCETTNSCSKLELFKRVTHKKGNFYLTTVQ